MEFTIAPGNFAHVQFQLAITQSKYKTTHTHTHALTTQPCQSAGKFLCSLIIWIKHCYCANAMAAQHRAFSSLWDLVVPLLAKHHIHFDVTTGNNDGHCNDHFWHIKVAEYKMRNSLKYIWKFNAYISKHIVRESFW